MWLIQQIQYIKVPRQKEEYKSTFKRGKKKQFLREKIGIGERLILGGGTQISNNLYPKVYLLGGSLHTRKVLNLA